MPAEPYHDFPLSPNRSWDASAAEPGLRKWASSDGSGDKDKIDWGKLKKVYFWHETGELDNFGQLKFPYCRIENDEPHVVHNAVQNALARIENSNIPENDKSAVRQVAERQMARFQGNEEGDSKAFDSELVYKFGEPNIEQIAKINRISKRTLTKDEVFIYTHKMAGDMVIPNRCIQLSKQLLEKFAIDANNGVAFMLDHPWAGLSRPKPALPYGRVFEGWLSNDNIVDGETVSLNGSAYIVRGQSKDGISTDAIISDIETGVLFDTSIGWGADKFLCSICGHDIRDYSKCKHIPGAEYANDDTGNTKMCYVIASPPGYLMEESAVFDGAYPEAGSNLSVINDYFENDYSVFTNVSEDFKQIPLNSRLYGTYSNKGGVLLFAKNTERKKIYAFSNNNILVAKGGESPMDENQTVEQTVEQTIIFMTTDQVIEKLGKEYTPDEVLRFAKEGIDYHKQTIEDAVSWGIRAMGNDFPVDTWKDMFANMSTQSVIDIKKTWEAQAKAAIPSGRQTDPAAGLDQQKIASTIPDDAFKVK